jgi:hypothetical protein
MPSSLTVSTESTRSRTIGKVTSPGSGVGRGLLGLDTDDADVGLELTHDEGDAGEQPAAAEAHDDRPDVGALLEDLEAAGALTRDDVVVVEGVDEDRARLLRPGARVHEALVEGGADLLDGGAVGLGRLDLGHGCPDGHVDLDVDPEHLAGERHALRVVARTGSDDATGLLVVGELGHAGVGAADLERPGALEVLALEEDVGPDPLGEAAVELHGCRSDDGREEVSGGSDLGHRHRRRCGCHGARVSPGGLSPSCGC